MEKETRTRPEMIAKYLTVKKALDIDPKLSSYQICRAYGVSYTGFKHWRSRLRTAADKEGVEIVSKKSQTASKTITVEVEIGALIQGYVPGTDQISVSVPIDDVLSKMSPEVLRQFVMAMIRQKQQERGDGVERSHDAANT